MVALSAEEIERQVRGYMATCTAGDASAIASYLDHQATHFFPYDMYDGPWTGAEYIAHRWTTFVHEHRSAWTVDAIAVDVVRQLAVSEWTHFKQDEGVILRGTEWYEFDANGKITEIRAYYASAQDKVRKRLELGGFDYEGGGYPQDPPA